MGKGLVGAVSTYLDTQVVVWLAAGRTEKFSARAVAAMEESELVVSPVAVLELAYLYEVGRITRAPLALLNQLESQIGLQQQDCSLAALMKTALFESWTRDPFDRLIVAHARTDRMAALVTSDQKIRDNYPKAIW